MNHRVILGVKVTDFGVILRGVLPLNKLSGECVSGCDFKGLVRG